MKRKKIAEDRPMVPKFKISIYLLFIAALLFICGCEHSSDDIPTGSPINVESLINSGWQYFMNGDYDAAIDDFLEASSRDAEAIEAYLGMGWSYMRDGQFNVAKSKIDGVWSLLSLGVVTDLEDSLRYCAESYACIAGVYAGLYPEDIPFYCPLVVDNVDFTLSIDANFIFTYDNSVNRQRLLVTKADAQFAMSDFAGALYTISEVDSALILNPAVIEYHADMPYIVETLFDSTTVLGYGRLTIPGAQLIDVMKVTDDSLQNSAGGFLEYTVAGFTTSGTQITFYGVPSPQTGNYYFVTYRNAADFIEFMWELRNIIDEHR